MYKRQRKHIEKVLEANIPLVLLDRTIPDLEVNHVTLNNKKALALAVGNLIEGGSRKIEMISYAWSVSNIAEREAGYQHTMKQFSLSENIRIHRLKYKNIPDQMEKVVTEAVNKGAEALVFATNTLAIAGMKTLCKHNLRVPDDIAVVCFDSSEAFELYYTTVTYIKQPVEQFGQEALDLLVKAIGQKEQTKCSTITLNPELVTGKSSSRK